MAKNISSKVKGKRIYFIATKDPFLRLCLWVLKATHSRPRKNDSNPRTQPTWARLRMGTNSVAATGYNANSVAIWAIGPAGPLMLKMLAMERDEMGSSQQNPVVQLQCRPLVSCCNVMPLAARDLPLENQFLAWDWGLWWDICPRDKWPCAPFFHELSPLDSRSTGSRPQ